MKHMQQYYRFDKDGYYLEPVIDYYDEDNPMPEDITDIRPPDGLYRGQFTGTEWVETAPTPDVEDGEVAIWDWEGKAWRVEPKPPAAPSVADIEEVLKIMLGGADDELD